MKKQPDIHLNLNVRGLPLSATLAINEISNDLIKQGQPVTKLGLGQSPFPVPQVVEEELKVNAHQKDYLPVAGLRELRGAVADYHHRTHGISTAPENILIGPGSKELMFILQLVYYGDLVIPTPSWVSYAPQAHIIGRHIHWLETDASNQWKVTPECIEELCHKDENKPRLVILNYPANPHGYTYTEKELKALAKKFRKYKVLVLSDEIYSELDYDGNHVSIAQFYPEGTIISSGLSKWCGAGGWRLGTFAFPNNMKWLLNAMATVASETFTSTSAPIQYAAVRAFIGGLEIERYLANSRRILHAIAKAIVSRLQNAGFDLVMPDGAFYIFPDFAPFKKKLNQRGITSSSKLCEVILKETGVAMLPGESFGRPKDELTVRIAFVDFDGARALTAAEQIPLDQTLGEEFAKQYGGGCISGVEKIIDWLNETQAE
ncbi:pyridoxal phosphate-dependent aminotransferase [Pleionea sediminis]|uniref:pyridoxal phosphate-dependent aminotransferase n=1 Tax=Pleionea sediminis TaxID=2569479 RepID=UPI001185A44D|nr:aminotransferase class I/II-fold pyridoxal phosphate-dependent enzyme [Pleionea sediminis]